MSEESESPRRDKPSSGYFTLTRNHVVSLILTAPLFLLYQLGVLFTDGWKNGVDFVTPRLYALSGHSTPVYLVLNITILGLMLGAARLMNNRARPSAKTWLLVLLESTLYATFLGQGISRLLLLLGLSPPGLNTSPLDSLVLSIGAGAYEELVFRLLLLSGLVWLGRALQLGTVGAIALAVLLSSFLFSAFHYQPLGTEAWQLWSFSFRFAAGLIFAFLFMIRGFAVAAYSHAIYDIHILVL